MVLDTVEEAEHRCVELIGLLHLWPVTATWKDLDLAVRQGLPSPVGVGDRMIRSSWPHKIRRG